MACETTAQLVCQIKLLEDKLEALAMDIRYLTYLVKTHPLVTGEKVEAL